MRVHRFMPFLLLVATLLSAPSGFAADKNKKTSDKPAELTDSDRKKLADIEQRPDVKNRIEFDWHARRLEQLRYLYVLNTLSARANSAAGPEYASFLERYDLLYSNPRLQRYLNTLGQRLVPKDSPNTYSFKLILNPMPSADAYSTGTVVLSTGLVAMLDNEAQLAYVIGHEIAHVEKKHEYEAIRQRVLEEELNKEKEVEAAKKRVLLGALVTAAGAGIGAAANGSNGAVLGAMAGLGGGYVAGRLLVHDRTTHTEWSEHNEDDADDTALKYLLDQSYDLREVPKVFARLQGAAGHDSRIGLGFIADPARMRERSAHVNVMLAGDLKNSINTKLKTDGLVGSTGEFALMMAALKRDNGIEAINYDLFDMARDNLEEAVNLRSNDSSAQLYLGKVLSLTARDEKDQQEAEKHFLKAIEYDQTRGAYPEPHLEHALHLMSQNGDKETVRKEVESYVALYQREHAGAVPGNMRILYDYLTLNGDTSWYTAPAAVVSTRYVDPLRTALGVGLQSSGSEVVSAATGASAPVVPASTPASADPKRPPVHKGKTP